MALYSKEEPEFFQKAVNSMLEQTVRPDEFVLVVDGPLTAELNACVEEYQIAYPNLFKIVRIKSNCGLGKALNIGINQCSNDIIARMDSDDISKADRCEKQLQRFCDNPNLDIVGSYADEFDGDVHNVISTRTVPIESETIYDFSKKRSAFNHPSVMLKKTSVLRAGNYSSLKRNQDLDLFGRMMFLGCTAENISESLLFYRCSDNLLRRRKSWENVSSYIHIIRNFWKMGYSSLSDYCFAVVTQMLVYVLPISFQKWVYKHIIRKI